MKYGSVCSGIEAASVAWHPLGWRASFLSEIEAFPRAVLSHHYPEVPLHGDFTTIRAGEYAPIDLLVGGTPCQSFSVAGLRGGLADERGNLALEYLRLAQRLRPRWLVWENVPGVLSSAGGRDFGAILGGLVELGYGFAYRVLDAQYVRVDGFGRAVPQRRRRVFVVGHLGDWRRAAAVLFERESLRGNPAPRREPRQGAAYDVAPCIAASGRGFERAGDTRGQDCLIPDVSLCLNGGGLGTDFDLDGGLLPQVVGSLDLDCGGGKLSNQMARQGHLVSVPAISPALETQVGGLRLPCTQAYVTDALPASLGKGLGHNKDGFCVPVAIQERAVSENMDAGPGGKGWSEDGAAYTLEARTVPQAVAFTCSEQANGFAWERDVYGSLTAQIPNDSSNIQQGVRIGWRVRRLTPTECEALQGFPRNYTNIPYRNKNDAPDGPRYKALGNSMAVNAMRWIGRRIEMVDAMKTTHV